MEYSDLSQLPLFKDMTPDEIEQAAAALCPREEIVPKNHIIYQPGVPLPDLCVVRSGSVNLEVDDLSGSRFIIDNNGPGRVFGLSHVLFGQPLLGRAVAVEPSCLLFLDVSWLHRAREHPQGWFLQFMSNLLASAASKHQTLIMRGVHVSPRRARDRILSFLTAMSAEKGSRDFEIPFDQQQLADYLNLDRSVVSKELNKLRREGSLWFSRNHFILSPSPDSTPT